MKSSRWTMVIVGVIAFLMLGTMVWASPPASAPSVPLLVPIDAQNAHRVDNHHAAASSASKSTRANRVLWADSSGRLHWRAMPAPALNNRFVNDDRQETIKAAVDGTLLTVNNTGTGDYVYGLKAIAEDRGVIGESPKGTGVRGSSPKGTGVYGSSSSGNAVAGGSGSGTGLYGFSNSGVPLQLWGISGSNLIEAWDEGAEPDELRFEVTRAGDVHISGLLRIGQYSSAPATCDADHDGAIALTSGYRLCVCKNGTGWVYTSDGTTSCTW